MVARQSIETFVDVVVADTAMVREASKGWPASKPSADRSR